MAWKDRARIQVIRTKMSKAEPLCLNTNGKHPAEHRDNLDSQLMHDIRELKTVVTQALYGLKEIACVRAQSPFVLDSLGNSMTSSMLEKEQESMKTACLELKKMILILACDQRSIAKSLGVDVSSHVSDLFPQLQYSSPGFLDCSIESDGQCCRSFLG